MIFVIASEVLEHKRKLKKQVGRENVKTPVLTKEDVRTVCEKFFNTTVNGDFVVVTRSENETGTWDVTFEFFDQEYNLLSDKTIAKRGVNIEEALANEFNVYDEIYIDDMDDVEKL